MKLKKWLLGLITFAAMAVICAVCAGAETYGDYEYYVRDDGTVEITKYIGSAEKVDIPEKIDGKSVTSIGDEAFRFCRNLTSITIPDSVTGIGRSAFFYCENLFNLTIGDDVTYIGSSAFSGCRSLTDITIPDGVDEIGWYAFDGCVSLKNVNVKSGNNRYTSVNGILFNKDKSKLVLYPAGKTDKIYNIPESVTEIGRCAFDHCISLTNVTIPNNMDTIGNYAFNDCANLTDIIIPDSVTLIGSFAFEGCTSLAEIKVATKNASYVSVNGVLCNKNKTTLMCYPAGKKDKNYSILDSVTEIDGHAFKGCTSLCAVTIPDGVMCINDGTFMNCTSLTSITIPNSVTSIYEDAFKGCASLISITIPDSVTSIGSNAFINCKSLTNIKISDSLTVIGELTFRNCANLTSITIPDGVTSIGYSAFEYCTSLKSITIPESVTSIGDCAFANCTSLTSITIPGSVKNIGDYALGFYIDYNTYNYTKYNNFKIYCYPGTSGEKYAKDNDLDYVLLDRLPTLAKITGVKLGGRAADALRINWTKNTSADGYIVEMYQNGKWTRVGKITNNSTTTFRKAGLKASTVYKFRVRAYKMSGSTAIYSDYSTELAARTNPSVIKGAKLGGRAADALRINWTKNASADGYIVEMYQGNKWVRVAKIANNSTTTFRKAGLKASTVYKFRVRAYKMSGKTALYGNYSATVTARTNPSIVKGVKIGGKAKNALRVNWAKNASAQGYIVEMYKGGKWVRVAKITKNSTNTYRKAGLAKNTTYKFRVKAYYMSGKTALYGNYGSVSGKTAAK